MKCDTRIKVRCLSLSRRLRVKTNGECDMDSEAQRDLNLAIAVCCEGLVRQNLAV